ncbi:MAG: hypothetical protein A4E45_00195 [Methanosaeta sp. PtaB.Bin039]|nr:MAG: hypothetical protein A4E45_00195 [Methanosaeta sp. PtaB.Bin039]OPY45690.1 MAG: hypothetical protein A4E47_00876 [Methanosaeta sp. PtaU1.Bin028]HOT07361.1 ArsR family transcriptional regulator [Methanotrichaceae archaeon]HQF17359.1 ArsR family transcriptional regulator [Methanotrichaceae archaeon]HQI91976.1 ArsR family transcriptional regulator [Methanotrichaceae archaeon]
MRKVRAAELGPDIEEFTAMLMQVGLRRNVAKVLAYLSSVKEATSREIEIGSDLRQPEVSIAMSELRELGWISERDEKNPGKGRPYRIYRLQSSMAQIIELLEQRTHQERAEIRGRIALLRSLMQAG